MNRIRILIGFIFLISGEIYSQEENIFYNGTFENALIKAKQENKFIFIDFYTVWCGSCKAYDKFVFSKSEIKAFIKEKFIALSIDAEKEEGKKLKNRYEVVSYPQIIIAYPDGTEIDRISTYDSKYSEDTQEFINKVNGILEGTSTIISLENDVRSNPGNLSLIEKLIYEYIDRGQYKKLPTYARELMQTSDSSIKDKGEFYYCYALLEDKDITDPNPMIDLLNKRTALIKDLIAAGYSSLLNYYQRRNDFNNINSYFQKVITADSGNWYYKRKYALFLFENNFNISKAQQIAIEYYNAPGIVDHYQPLLMAYSCAQQANIEKGMKIFDEYMLKVASWSMDDKQWAYYYYADFADKHNIRLDKALGYAKEVSDYRGQNIDSKVLYANLLVKNGEVKVAVDILKDCLNDVQAEKQYEEINNLIKQYQSE